MKIGNERTPQKVVHKMKELAAGLQRMNDGGQHRPPKVQGRIARIYEGDARVDERPINGCEIRPIYDAEGNVQNMLMTPPGGGDLLIPFAPVEGGFGRIGDGKGTLLITEEWSDGFALNSATGHSTAVTVCAENLPYVCRALRAKFPELAMVVCIRGSGPAADIAEAAAGEIAARLAYPHDATCFADVYDKNGAEAVEACVAAANDADSAACYDHTESREPLLWPRPVDGLGVIRDLCRLLNSYLSLPSGAAVAIALYVVFTYTMPVARVAPILAVLSVVKRCGKTTLLSLLTKLVFRPVSSSNLSPAAMYRVVDQTRPCLILDEADTFLGQSSELTGIINSGYTRDTAFVHRAEAGGKRTMRFSTFCAKIIAMIGSPPETILDRSIAIKLQRKLPTELKKRLAPDESIETTALRARIARFAADNLASIKGAEFEPPQLGNDRLADTWHPLLSIASVVGPECFAKACGAAKLLGGNTQTDDAGPEELLRDIKAIFERSTETKLATAQLITKLCDDDEGPWFTFNRGKPITPQAFAKLLRPFGISSKNLRVDHVGVAKGYALEDFTDAFARYVVQPPL